MQTFDEYVEWEPDEDEPDTPEHRAEMKLVDVSAGIDMRAVRLLKLVAMNAPPEIVRGSLRALSLSVNEWCGLQEGSP